MDLNNRLTYNLYKGTVNKGIRVNYSYKYEPGGDFPTTKISESGTIVVNNGFALTISEGFNLNHIFIPGNMYWTFVSMLHKTIPLIQSCLNELYTNMNEDEFEMNIRATEIFIQEKSMRVNGLSIVPSKWVNDVNKCFAALQINGEYGESIVPLQDAIAIDTLLTHFDPNTFGLLLLETFMK